MKPNHLKKFCQPDAPGQSIPDKAVSRLGLSARAYHRILRVSRTIADLETTEKVSPVHLLEAVLSLANGNPRALLIFLPTKGNLLET